ncbi:MAG: aromatic amino acid transport family protein, partial [Simkaniaceae bacterium]|nr:aromatic amino acid transport family protein [Simkaniaceae bacterium]
MSEKHQGSVFGGMLLTAGSCIGAGMLALPILTGVAGFFPTMVMFFIAWLFMTSTAFLLIEVNSWFEGPVNLLSMVGKTLGKFGQLISWFLYLFLFYALLVAYMSDSGNHVSLFFKNVMPFTIPDWGGSLFFVIFFGWLVYLGTRTVDMANRWLMAGKIVAYLCLIIFGIKFVKPAQLAYSDVKYTFFAVP